MTDEELAEKAQKGDSVAMETLIHRCRQMVLSFARSYFLSGGDTEDLIQEGMIGVFRAVTTFNNKSSFKSYAYLCIKTAIFSLIRSYTSEKHKLLTNYVSLSGCVDFDLDKTDIVMDENFEPEREYINKETETELKNTIKEILSEYEFKILTYYLQGYSYGEIASFIGSNSKSIDNAIQRIRKKLWEKIKK